MTPVPHASHLPRRHVSRRRAGFTLAEVAVTIAIVGLALAWMLQTLSSSKMTAAYSRNLKLARELSLYTLGQIESGLFEEELENERIEGVYADEGYPDFAFEAVIGDESLSPDPTNQQSFDNWRHERDQRDRKRSSATSDEDEEEVEEPYERIQVRVTFPKLGELKNEYVIERWLPWRQLHPEEPTGEDGAAGAGSSGSSAGQSGSGAAR